MATVPPCGPGLGRSCPLTLAWPSPPGSQRDPLRVELDLMSSLPGVLRPLPSLRATAGPPRASGAVFLHAPTFQNFPRHYSARPQTPHRPHVSWAPPWMEPA